MFPKGTKVYVSPKLRNLQDLLSIMLAGGYGVVMDYQNGQYLLSEYFENFHAFTDYERTIWCPEELVIDANDYQHTFSIGDKVIIDGTKQFGAMDYHGMCGTITKIDDEVPELYYLDSTDEQPWDVVALTKVPQ